MSQCKIAIEKIGTNLSASEEWQWGGHTGNYHILVVIQNIFNSGAGPFGCRSVVDSECTNQSSGQLHRQKGSLACGCLLCLPGGMLVLAVLRESLHGKSICHLKCICVSPKCVSRSSKTYLTIRNDRNIAIIITFFRAWLIVNEIIVVSITVFNSECFDWVLLGEFLAASWSGVAQTSGWCWSKCPILCYQVIGPKGSK